MDAQETLQAATQWSPFLRDLAKTPERCNPLLCHATSRGKPCRSSWHSLASVRARNADWAAITAYGLTAAADLGRGIYALVIHLPPGAGSIESNRLAGRFKRGLAAVNRQHREDIAYRARLHATGRAGGGPHWHPVVHSERTLGHILRVIKQVWAGAGGDPTAVDGEEVQNIGGIAAYIAHQDREHQDPESTEVFHEGIITTISNKIYFPPGGEKGARKTVYKLNK